MSYKIGICAAIALALAGTSVGAHADTFPGFSSAPEKVEVKVPYKDLDLGSEAGATTLLHRIRHAARQICGDGPDDRLFETARQYRTCMDSTVDRAVASLNNPIVAMLNGARGGNRSVVIASRAK